MVFRTRTREHCVGAKVQYMGTKVGGVEYCFDVENKMYVCTICDQFRGRSFAAVLRHIGASHRYDPGLSIRCGIRSCPETCTKFESFRSHVYRKHRDVLHLDSRDNGPSEGGVQEFSAFPEDPVDNDICSQPNTAEFQPSGVPILQSSAAKFLIKMKEECKLTQVLIDKIVTSVRGLWDQAMQGLQQWLAGLLPGDFDESIFNTSLFDGIETHHLQQKYYREHFQYVLSQVCCYRSTNFMIHTYRHLLNMY